MSDAVSKKGKSNDHALVSQKVVFVRNLPFSTTDTDLENLFSDIGPIRSSFVIRENGKTDQCRGFGYVIFALPEDAEKAASAVKTFRGRKLGVCFANKKPKQEKRKFKPGGNASREDDNHTEDNPNVQEDETITALDPEDQVEEPSARKPKSQRKNTKSDIGRTVVITGLADELKPNHIRKKCRKIGKVEKVTFPVEGREKATAFVVFESHKDARVVVKKLSGRIFKGNTIEAVLLSREGKMPSQKSLKKSRIIVRNLSFKCKEEDLQNFFSHFGQIINVHIPTKLDGERKCRAGFGFVQFSNFFEAAKAIKESNMKKILGRPVAVDWAMEKSVYEMKKGLKEDESKREENEEEVDEAENVERNSADEQEGDTEAENVGKNSADEKKRDSEDLSDSQNDTETDSDSSGKEHDHSDNEQEEEGEEHKDEQQHKHTMATQQPKRVSDVKEGKTLFIRNLSFDTNEESLCQLLEQFGEMEYCIVLEDKRTGHSRGMAFVKFKSMESAEKCLVEAGDQGSGLSLDNFKLNITKAVTRGKAAELAKEKKVEGKKVNKDKRNLYLAKEGLILAGSSAAQGLSKGDLLKRQNAEKEKKAKLADPNYFVSPTRLCVRNLPLNVGDNKLKEIFSTSTGRKLHVNSVLIVRSKDRMDSAGRARSLGFGFVEFNNHNDALAALRATNNNPDIFGADRRPIVEFSLENNNVVKAKKRRLDKGRHQQRQVEEEHANTEKPKTNKEKRLEKNMKRREARQRKREAKKKRKSAGQKAADEDSAVKHFNKDGEGSSAKRNSWKAKRGKNNISTELPGPRKLDKNDRQSRKQFSSIPSSPPSKMKESSHKQKNMQTTGWSSLSSSGVETFSSVSKKRKGRRRKEQDKIEESNFSDLVNKYKKKLFGENDGESPAKRPRWFDD
ncbi:RNA-binding protein 28-like [Montipora capricornis]|uniref:RNA-binding protein 28-like n=1 Tax=Montipora capricornis TaxID=246305 RepID=UPI0035F146D7